MNLIRKVGSKGRAPALHLSGEPALQQDDSVEQASEPSGELSSIDSFIGISTVIVPQRQEYIAVIDNSLHSSWALRSGS